MMAVHESEVMASKDRIFGEMIRQLRGKLIPLLSPGHGAEVVADPHLTKAEVVVIVAMLDKVAP